MRSQINNAYIQPGYKSDHNYVTITIQPNEQQRGKGLWKYNSKLLEREDIKKEVIHNIQEVVSMNKGCSNRLLWDTIKCMTRGCLISMSSKINREKECRLDMLAEEIEAEYKNLQTATATTTADIRIRLQLLKQEQDDIIEERTRGAVIRSQCQWYYMKREKNPANSSLT